MINLILDIIKDYGFDKTSIDESFERLVINASSSNLINIDKNFIKKINNQFLSKRECILDFILTINENDIIYDFENPSLFWEQYSDAIDFNDMNSDCNCKLSIITKKYIKDKILSIYHFDSFLKYIDTINFNDILNIFYDYKYTYFEILDNSFDINSHTNMFYFYSVGQSIYEHFDKNNSQKVLEIQHQNCIFANRILFDFEPNNFNLIGNSNNKLHLFFKKLLIIFSLISVFDNSEIKENNLELSLCGKSILNFKIDCKNIILDKAYVYYEIFNWIYQKGNAIDKLLVTRNVLFVNIFRNNTILLPNTILATIKSNYKIYTQDNYAEYVSSKTTAISTLLDIQKQISELSNNLTDNFIKNITMFCTFIFTIIILNSVNNGKFSEIFTKEITLISTCLIMISIIFLVYTLIDINSKKENLISLQKNIKLIYNDILSPETLDEIVDKNAYYITSQNELNKRINIYKYLWLIVISAFSIATLALGWKHFLFVFEYVKNFIQYLLTILIRKSFTYEK